MIAMLIRSTLLTALICIIPAKRMLAQEADVTYLNNIQNIKLHTVGNPLGYPIIRLGSADQLELHFDDREAGTKAYSYT